MTPSPKKKFPQSAFARKRKKKKKEWKGGVRGGSRFPGREKCRGEKKKKKEKDFRRLEKEKRGTPRKERNRRYSPPPVELM